MSHYRNVKFFSEVHYKTGRTFDVDGVQHEQEGFYFRRHLTQQLAERALARRLAKVLPGETVVTARIGMLDKMGGFRRMHE